MLSVADHEGVFCVDGILVQRISNDVRFFVTRSVHGCARNADEIFCHAEMLYDTLGKDFRLGRGDIQLFAVSLQHL